MIIQKNYIYHIYNQGNNRNKIFFKQSNYLFFIEKIRTYILPYADILAWCLMPNHFHLMVYVRELELPVPEDSQGFTRSETLTKPRVRTLNDSIGIMLRSYTRAINKQENFSGSLFRKETKAECVNCPQGVAPAYISDGGVTRINVDIPERQYPQICFNYIHRNPVIAGLVEKAADWEFSSVTEYAGLKNWELVNKELAREYVDIDVLE